jgi:hypothetical protein
MVCSRKCTHTRLHLLLRHSIICVTHTQLRHYRTSAKSGEGVDEMFAQLAEDLPSQTPEKLEFPPHERLACIPAFPTYAYPSHIPLTILISITFLLFL